MVPLRWSPQIWSRRSEIQPFIFFRSLLNGYNSPSFTKYIPCCVQPLQLLAEQPSQHNALLVYDSTTRRWARLRITRAACTTVETKTRLPGTRPLRATSQCRFICQERRKRWNWPCWSTCMRWCYEASNQGGRGNRQDRRCQVQDFWLRFGHCFQQLHDRTCPRNDSWAGWPDQEHRNSKGAVPPTG